MQSLERDLELLVRDKYDGDATRVTEDDRARLAAGEPLAYAIGWVPFCDTRILLTSKPLIPRPETEWWTELLIRDLQRTEQPCHVLDMCAGSGCIGIAILAAVPHAHVTFAELNRRHADTIHASIIENGIDPSRVTIRTGDLWSAISDETVTEFSVIAANPPYIPDTRSLDSSVTAFEPYEALFAGSDGMNVIRRIIEGGQSHLTQGGSLWMECDIANVRAAQQLCSAAGAQAKVVDDQYNRPRLVVASWQ